MKNYRHPKYEQSHIENKNTIEITFQISFNQ